MFASTNTTLGLLFENQNVLRDYALQKKSITDLDSISWTSLLLKDLGTSIKQAKVEAV